MYVQPIKNIIKYNTMCLFVMNAEEGTVTRKENFFYNPKDVSNNLQVFILTAKPINNDC